jgi:Cu+-exporting ATPase
MTVASVAGDPDAVALAGAVEDGSEHPIGQAIARYATSLSTTPASDGLPAVADFIALPGAGVRGSVDGAVVTVGSPKLFSSVAPELVDVVTAGSEAGRTVALAGWDDVARAAFVVADEVKPSAAAAVARLQAMGLRVLMLTGDDARTAAVVAGQVGIAEEDVFAEVGPAGKVSVLGELGLPVAFVGDGVNDAAALATASLGIAIGAGADAAIGAADLTLVGGSVTGVADALLLARATVSVIRGNLLWASCYNLVAIPLAALGYLNPLFAGIAMSASSLIVVGNSLRLRRFTP